MTDPLITLPAAAKFCGMKPESLMAFVRDGSLRAFNLSRGTKRPRYKVAPDDLQKFLDSRAVHATPKPVQRVRRPVVGDVPSRY